MLHYVLRWISNNRGGAKITTGNRCKLLGVLLNISAGTVELNPVYSMGVLYCLPRMQSVLKVMVNNGR